MTENAMISAEDFGQLYASLETLEIQQITSALIRIPKLREEIKKRLAAPRKRRSKSAMLTEASIQIARKDNSIHKRKPRKSTPTKITTSTTKVVPVKHSGISSQKEAVSYTPTHLPLDLIYKKELASPVTSPAQTQAAFSTAPEISSCNLPNNSHTLPHTSHLHPGQFPLVNPSLSHWYNSWYRMTTAGFSGLSKPSLPLYPDQLTQHSQSHMPSHMQSQQEQVFPLQSHHSPRNAATDLFSMNSAYQQEASQSTAASPTLQTATPVRDSINEVENRGAPSPCGSNPNTTLAGSVTPESIAAESVTCPDCGASVFLSLLQSHLEAGCAVKAADVEQVSNEDVTIDVDDTESINWEKCAICSVEVPGEDMVKHIKQQHGRTKKHPFQCDVCFENFRNKSTLKRHKITHTEGGGHKCSYCEKIFAKRELVKRHEMLHTDESRILWPCPHCSKGFSNKYNLAVHERIHTGELPFKCPECPLCFRVKCSMQNHMRSKHQATNYNSDMESSNQSPYSIASTNQSNTDALLD